MLVGCGRGDNMLSVIGQIKEGNGGSGGNSGEGIIRRTNLVIRFMWIYILH